MLGVWVPTPLHFHSSCPPRCGSFFVPLVEEMSSANVQVVLGDSCSVRSCTFGVPTAGGELRVFLLCHLDPSSSACHLIVARSCPERTWMVENVPNKTGGSGYGGLQAACWKDWLSSSSRM